MNKVLEFLKLLIDRIEKNKLDPECRSVLIEIYTRCLHSEIAPPFDETSDKNLLRYLTMGWFIYNQIESTSTSDVD